MSEFTEFPIKRKRASEVASEFRDAIGLNNGTANLSVATISSQGAVLINPEFDNGIIAEESGGFSRLRVGGVIISAAEGSVDCGQVDTSTVNTTTLRATSTEYGNNATFTYGTGAADAHLTALGAGATGVDLFLAATAGDARDAMGLDDGTANLSVASLTVFNDSPTTNPKGTLRITGAHNLFLQTQIPPNLTSTAEQNTGVGGESIESLTSGRNNSGLGYRALNACTTGRDNSGVGHSALSSITFGSYNAAVGSAALQNCTSGNSNAALGMEALQSLTIVAQNSALGNSALKFVTTGAGNTGIGFRAGHSNVAGQQANLTQGKNNTLLGNSAGVSSAIRNQSIALGYRATTQSDGELAIGAATAAIKGGTTGATYNSTSHGITHTVTAPANPSTPVGWLDARINGTLFKIPLYQ